MLVWICFLSALVCVFSDDPDVIISGRLVVRASPDVAAWTIETASKFAFADFLGVRREAVQVQSQGQQLHASLEESRLDASQKIGTTHTSSASPSTLIAAAAPQNLNRKNVSSDLKELASKERTAFDVTPDHARDGQNCECPCSDNGVQRPSTNNEWTLRFVITLPLAQSEKQSILSDIGKNDHVTSEGAVFTDLLRQRLLDQGSTFPEVEIVSIMVPSQLESPQAQISNLSPRVRRLQATNCKDAPVTSQTSEKKKKEFWKESAVTALLFFSWVVLLLVSLRERKKHKRRKAALLSSPPQHLNFLDVTRSFEKFCNAEVGESGLEREIPFIHEKRSEIQTCIMNYCQFVATLFRVCIKTSWRFMAGMGLYSLTISNLLRGVKQLDRSDSVLGVYRDECSQERVVYDETINVNLDGAKAMLNVLLVFATAMLTFWVVMRVIWLYEVYEAASNCALDIERLAKVASNAVPSIAQPQVAEVRWSLYRYLNLLHIYSYADVSHGLNLEVRDEKRLFLGKLMRTGMMTEEEAHYLRKEGELQVDTLLVWISSLALDIAKACEYTQPCTKEMMKSLKSLRCSCHAFPLALSRCLPQSLTFLIHLMIDSILLLLPLAIADTVGTEHDGYSFYFFPCVGTILISGAFHGSLRLVAVTADPFGPTHNHEKDAGKSLQQTERKLYVLLAIWLRAPRLSSSPFAQALSEGETGRASVTSTKTPVDLALGEPLQPIREESHETEVATHSLDGGWGGSPQEDFRDETGMPREASDLGFNKSDNSRSNGIDNPDCNDERSVRPPVFYTDSTVDFDKPLPLRSPKPLKDKIAEVEKRLAACKAEKEWYAELLVHREEEIRTLQSQSVPKEDAEQVLGLMNEWVAPPKPTPLSSRTLQRLHRISTKQSLRVQKILTLPPGGRENEEESAQTQQRLLQVEGYTKSTPLLHELMQDLRERLREEQEDIIRLTTERDVLAHPVTLADVEQGQTKKKKLKASRSKLGIPAGMYDSEESALNKISEEGDEEDEEPAKYIPMSEHEPRSLQIATWNNRANNKPDRSLAITDAGGFRTMNSEVDGTRTRNSVASFSTLRATNRGLTREGILK